MGKRDEILSLFPDGLKGRMKPVLENPEHLNEIRLGTNCPCRIIREGCEYFLSPGGMCLTDQNGAWQITAQEIESIVNQICNYSLYAFENELRQGFLTVQGGHRIGFAGKVILNTDGSLRNLSYIRFLNIRISHEILGMADPVLPYLFDQEELYNTLIVSPPGCGKTTLLRDLIRQVSDGTKERKGQQVAVVDERSEIAGSYQGIPQNQVGIRTDVLDACPKTEGMMLLMRSMTPRVIAVDEIGSEEDLAALQRIAVCGTGVLATMHGYSMEDVRDKLGKIEQLFGRFLLLTFKNRKRIVRIYDKRKELLQEAVL